MCDHFFPYFESGYLSFFLVAQILNPSVFGKSSLMRLVELPTQKRKVLEAHFPSLLQFKSWALGLGSTRPMHTFLLTLNR